MRLISDNRRAKELAGWQPRYTLEQGLGEAIEWVGRNRDRFRPDVYAV